MSNAQLGDTGVRNLLVKGEGERPGQLFTCTRRTGRCNFPQVASTVTGVHPGFH